MMRRCLLLLFTLLLLAQPASALSDAVPSDQTLFEQALAASRQGEAAEALPLWDAFLARHPEDAAAWMLPVLYGHRVSTQPRLWCVHV